MYAFEHEKTITFSDGGALLKSVKGIGAPRLKVIQDVLGTFELSLMEDFTVMDLTNRAISTRVLAFLQAWCTIDGILRVWDVAQKEVINGLRSARQRSDDDETLRESNQGFPSDGDQS
jgi:hypothetical protein